MAVPAEEALLFSAGGRMSFPGVSVAAYFFSFAGQIYLGGPGAAPPVDRTAFAVRSHFSSRLCS
ncbi:hypothetical protein C8N31_106248 [Sulfitobacter mediterraneus]|uniref:Uncharacterized protein n=1 Tax=Sulfitobacter mediterraneus TaxID=83219 RepID=A0A2T6CE71_9RHOB|nr:hypothetical protein C8N31_106248 [Sulfitobacter mediterraneus]